ncbi:MAG: hypothetical protein LBT47_03485 [Deltaproteobacteria bacterium]|jgi:hypothetical protein|nr:hypothetical protein [Deltaproteobacteria bacterium]
MQTATFTQTRPLTIDVHPVAGDRRAFDRLTSVVLSQAEKELAVTPDQIAPLEPRLMATHFHPERVPLELIQQRLSRAFPAATDSLVIPTQHNQIMTMDQWAGVEADAYSPDYGEKIHLLFHFKASSLPKAGTFLSMMERTFRYRALQLLEIMEALTNPDQSTTSQVKKNGLDNYALGLAGSFAARLSKLIDDPNIFDSSRVPMLKNRLLTDFMAECSGNIEQAQLDQALSVVSVVKGIVKKRFDPNRFHTVHEVIEEARSFGAGVVIPHPPLFWPVLLDDLDIDGWEVWNPSTPNHTRFLIDCLGRIKERKRKLLAFMGDDTHMSSKIRPEMGGKKNNQNREIGFQPPWCDPQVAAALAALGQSRERTMDEYRARLA